MYPDKLLTRHFFTPSVRNKVIANRNLKVKKNFSELLNKANEGSSGLEFLSSIITQVREVYTCTQLAKQFVFHSF